MEATKKKSVITSFSLNYWIVILMEFFERGSYYGMMSILSVYMTDQLNFSKESVGVIKSTIQPLLYILPILAGAIGDRFGYKKTLTFAFIFLGIGYFLTSQTTEYAMVFASLVIMGIGAGAFKPMISGTIARETNETNSTV
ncbi:MAG: MFS transporter, partial [Ignavibacteria bacterium]|nr:MFS transporter [Ignavibacteria bacterium]